MTASTGIAASHLEGTTLHAFAGIGLGKETAQVLLNVVRRSRHSTERWTETNVLIIDESERHSAIVLLNVTFLITVL